MLRILKIASAFIGVIVGAGAASGREIVQYFTSFGTMGTMAAIVATALFAFLGMQLVRLGSRLKAKNHKEVIYKISGKTLGTIIDWIIVLTLFGVGIAMVAGAGANLHQQFGISPVIGNIILVVLVFATVLMNVDKVINVIGMITPVLILAVIAASVYSLLNMEASFSELEPVALTLDTSLTNWLLSAINYVSFNIAVGASMSLVIGGAEDNEKIATWGGLIGGLGLGVIITLSHLAIFSQAAEFGALEMPMLAIINEISPVLGIIFAFVLFLMIFNTALGMFFAFGARFFEVGTPQFIYFLLATLLTGFALSLFGFTQLVKYFYPIVGYMGMLLVIVLIVSFFRMPKKVEINE